MTDAVRTPDAGSLAGYLRRQRWFGEKGREIHGAELSDVIPVQWPGQQARFAVARAEVRTDAGTTHYQLFLTQGGESLDDALREEEFRRGLANAFATGAAFQSGRARWIIESETHTALVVPPASPVRLSSAEQSNSSIIIDAEAVLKLFRKLQPGVHPDVEVTRFLTVERRFLHVPVLLGTIHFADARGVSVAGMLQELVPGAVDGWTYALECSKPFFEGSEGEQSDVPFEDDARQLGSVTRAMHEALASGDPGSDFDLRAAGAADTQRWAQGAEDTIDRACDALDRALADNRLPATLTDEARSVVERRLGFLTRVRQLAADVADDAGANTRAHGDYHLGQVLRSSAARFLVIDFEGEPMRPLEERRARTSPLRDVAGMLRSLEYAAAVGAGADDSVALGAQARARGIRWAREVRAAFLRGYFGDDARVAELLPRSQNNAGRLLALFEAEKVFYELHYEIDHRPDWAWVPLRGITELFA